MWPWPNLTARGRHWLHRGSVWDAPQGQSPRRVALDEQLVEGLPSAKEEARHRRADQELGGNMETEITKNTKARAISAQNASALKMEQDLISSLVVSAHTGNNTQQKCMKTKSRRCDFRARCLICVSLVQLSRLKKKELYQAKG